MFVYRLKFWKLPRRRQRWQWLPIGRWGRLLVTSKQFVECVHCSLEKYSSHTLVVQINPKPNAISYLRFKNFSFFQTRFFFSRYIHHFNQILCLTICIKVPVMTTKTVLYSLRKKIALLCSHESNIHLVCLRWIHFSWK